MKCSGTKTKIIGRLVTNWKLLCDIQLECDNEERRSTASGNIVQGTFQLSNTDASRDLPVFEAIRSWTKDVLSVTGFTFMQIYEYLVNSSESTFDEESMKAFKSLKAYKYHDHADGLVRNVVGTSSGTERQNCCKRVLFLLLEG